MMENGIVVWVVCVPLLISVIFGLGMYRHIKRRVEAVGGWQGVNQAIEEARRAHPARSYAVVQPVGKAGTNLGICLALLLVVVAAAGIGLAFQLRMIREMKLLKNEGMVTKATVMGARISESDEGSDTYYVSYAFVTSSTAGEKQAISRKEQVSQSIYSRTQIGDEIEIIYARSDPSVARITAQYRPGRVIYWPAIGGGFVALLALTVLSRTYRHYRNARRLESEGVDIVVPILDLYEVSDSESTSHYVAYQLPGEPPIRHTVTSKFYKRFKPGDIVRVRYLPDNPNVFDLVG